jgi:hypothetical protein
MGWTGQNYISAIIQVSLSSIAKVEKCLEIISSSYYHSIARPWKDT